MDLSEIEKAVRDNDIIDRVSVIVYKPNEPLQKILCHFTLKERESDNGFTDLTLKEKLKTVLPEYAMPNTLIRLKGMPLLVNGKHFIQFGIRKVDRTTKIDVRII